MKELTLKARAKINLGLDVIGERADGYHELRMIMQTVKLFDRVSLRRTEMPGIHLKTNLAYLPTDGSNLAVRAAALMLDEFCPDRQDGLEISLEKRIPVAAGLAGGSANAAAVLVGVNRMYHLNLTQQELMERGVKLGADVPYCIMRGTALAEGIGDQLTQLPAPPKCSVLLAKPAAHVSTKEVYTALDAAKDLAHPDIDGQIEALRDGDLYKLCRLMGNVLETVTIPRCGVVGQIRDEMKRGGAVGAMMSGSGPTVFGLFDDEEKARQTAERLRAGNEAKVVYLTEFYNPMSKGRTGYGED